MIRLGYNRVASAAAYFLLIVLLTGTAVRADSSGEAKRWLAKMLDASRSVSYEGAFVFVRGKFVDAMRISHSIENGEQRMTSLSGPAREILVRDDAVMCLYSKRQLSSGAVNADRTMFPVSFPYDLDSLEQHYKFFDVGDDRIAERPTRVIDVKPRDRYRFGYRLWLDQATGMVLRFALVDLDGHYIEHLVFVDFQIKSIIERNPRVTESDFTTGAARAFDDEVARASNWHVSLPPGFYPIRVQPTSTPRVQKLHPSSLGEPLQRESLPREQRIYSDGLATVSVFIEPLAGDATPLLDGLSRQNGVNVFGAEIDGHQVLVVGEVPEATAQLIGSSIASVTP